MPGAPWSMQPLPTILDQSRATPKARTWGLVTSCSVQVGVLSLALSCSL